MGLLEDKVALGNTRCSLSNSDFPRQYHTLSVHMTTVMENGALIHVSVRVFWLSAVIVVQSIEDLW
jgi:hypothetical protein